MKKIIFVLICLLLAGCGAGDDFIDAGEKITGSGTTVPVDETETPYIARKASTQSQYETYWNEWQIAGEMKELDFAEYDAYFILAYGSSSCPPEISQYRFREDTLYIKMQSAGGNCTADMSPVSYVLQTDKHEEVTKLIVNEYQKEADVDLLLE